MSLCLPFLMFQGDAQKALNHYLEAFPDAELRDLVLHPEGTEIYSPDSAESSTTTTPDTSAPGVAATEETTAADVAADAETGVDAHTSGEEYAEETLAEVNDDVLGSTQPVSEALAEDFETPDEEPAAYAGEGEVGPDPSEDSEDPDVVFEERMDEAHNTVRETGEMVPEEGEEADLDAPATSTVPTSATASTSAYSASTEEEVAELSAEDRADLDRQSTPEPENPTETQPLVATAQLVLGGQTLMIQDSLVRQDFTFTPAMSIAMLVDSDEEFRHVTETLVFGGEYLMEPGSYDFAKNFAWVKDQFGLTWQINQPLNGAQDPDSAAYAAPAQAPDWS